MKIQSVSSDFNFIDVTDVIEEKYPLLDRDLKNYSKGNFNDRNSNDFYIFYPTDDMKAIDRGMSVGSILTTFGKETALEWGWYVDNEVGKVYASPSESIFLNVPAYKLEDTKAIDASELDDYSLK